MNKVTLAGKVENIQFDHSYRDENYYKVSLSILRDSGHSDKINVITKQENLDESITVSGRVRSYNRRDADKNRLIIYVQAEEIKEFTQSENLVDVEGYIVQPPVKRVTPLGKDICDIMVAVNRKSGRADYIPCIAWGKLAHVMSEMHTGEVIHIQGRLQSREYEKKVDDIIEVRTAYELSIFKLL